MLQKNDTDHISVLLDEVIEYLDPKAGDTYLDATAGYGGHAGTILAITKAPAVLVDRDQTAVLYLAKKFKEGKVRIVHSDFLAAAKVLKDKGQSFDLILADLGVSSPHLNMASRGFSFKPGPLDMRMDQSQALSAADIVNSYDEAELAKLLRLYGEEPQANKIARAIVTHRPINATDELAEIILSAVRRGKGKIHPATKTFQALRIAVNNELSQLERTLPVWIDLLKPGGRIAVISFHSLEDRLVKQAFAEAGGRHYEAVLQILTKRPVTADQQELVFNPRARSAKLRAAAKIKI